MILVALILVPVAGGLLAWAAGAARPAAARWVAMGALAADLGLAVAFWFLTAGPDAAGWLETVSWAWLPRFGIRFHLGIDGLSYVLVVLTLVLGLLAVASSWTVRERVGFFHFNLLWTLAGVTGVFLALDLFLFYFFWELMLVPMYLLIGIWGYERRIYAAVKFFIFTQASGLLMLLAIIGLAHAHFRQTGVLTFTYGELLGTDAGAAAMWLMLGFFIAFAVKLPVVPLHTWLPDAHTQAPTAGSVVLAGLLLKTGGYGILRFAVPLFPEASATFAPYAMALGAAGVIYGAVLAFAQTDLKRLVAYTSVSHLGFVLLGIYAWNPQALQGVVLEMVCHGLATGGLFILVGMLYDRTHTRDLRQLGGLWSVAPRLGGAGLTLALAALGLPGLGTFVAEFLILVGSFRVAPVITGVATAGLIIATVYALRIVQRAFHGENPRGWAFRDLGGAEIAVMGVLIGGLLWLGLYPEPVIEAVGGALETLRGPAAWAGAEPAP